MATNGRGLTPSFTSTVAKFSTVGVRILEYIAALYHTTVQIFDFCVVRQYK
jgi:hypothetical protein